VCRPRVKQNGFVCGTRRERQENEGQENFKLEKSPQNPHIAVIKLALQRLL
jgi:hypothetical protein